MSKKMKAVSVLAGLALFSACADSPTAVLPNDGSPTTVLPPDGSPSFATSGNAPVHSVSGGGKVDLSSFSQSAGIETYGFHASIDGNGEVTGEFQATWDDLPAVTFHADVTCLAVAGNDAWIGAVVTQTHDPAAWPVGTEGVIHVQDNGQGANAPDHDQLGFWGLINASFCETMPEFTPFDILFPWIHGNLQVR